MLPWKLEQEDMKTVQCLEDLLTSVSYPYLVNMHTEITYLKTSQATYIIPCTYIMHRFNAYTLSGVRKMFVVSVSPHKYPPSCISSTDHYHPMHYSVYVLNTHTCVCVSRRTLALSSPCAIVLIISSSSSASQHVLIKYAAHVLRSPCL